MCKERNEYIDEIKELSEKGLTLFSNLSDRLNSLRNINLHEKQIQKLDLYTNQVNPDSILKHKIETINLLLTKSLSNQTDVSNNDGLNIQNELIDYNQIDLLLIDLKRFIGYNVNYWNNKMNDFLKKSKYENVLIKQVLHLI